VPTLAKLHKMFYASQLKQGSRPDEWLVELERIRVLMAQMNSTMTDAQFMVHVMNNLMPDYDLVVDIHSRRIGAVTNPLTIEELREELDLRYEVLADRKSGHKNKNHNNTEDTAL
jgi:predicted deacylase